MGPCIPCILNEQAILENRKKLEVTDKHTELTAVSSVLVKLDYVACNRRN